MYSEKLFAIRYSRGRQAVSTRPKAVLSGGLAQLARAPALQAGGQRFESVILHHSTWDGFVCQARGYHTSHLSPLSSHLERDL